MPTDSGAIAPVDGRGGIGDSVFVNVSSTGEIGMPAVALTAGRAGAGSASDDVVAGDGICAAPAPTVVPFHVKISEPPSVIDDARDDGIGEQEARE